MAIVHCPSPKKWRIAGPSHESCRESSDDSAEVEDRWQHRNNDGRTHDDGDAKVPVVRLMTSAMGSGESGRGWTTKATDERGQP